jgi:hypothetical protein
MFKLEQLSGIKEGDLIEFRYNPHLLGISPKKVIAKFQSNNTSKKYLIVRKLYYDPVPALGGEWEVNYDQIIDFKKRVWNGAPG